MVIDHVNTLQGLLHLASYRFLFTFLHEFEGAQVGQHSEELTANDLIDLVYVRRLHALQAALNLPNMSECDGLAIC